ASAPRPRVSDSAPGLGYLDEPVARAMAIDPADRYPDAATFGRELVKAQRQAADAPTQARIAQPRQSAVDDTHDLPVTTVAPPAPAPRRRRRGGLLAVLAILLVAAAVVVVVVANTGNTTKGPSPAAVAAAQTRADQKVVARLVRHYGRALDTHDLTLLAR